MEHWEELVKQYWGDRLMRFSHDTLLKFKIDALSIDILHRIGLPNVAVNFALIFNVASALERIEFRNESFIILGENVGDDLGIYVCLKENSPEIYQLSTSDDTAFFMNSSLKELLLYLHEFSEFILKGQTLSEDEYLDNEEMRMELKEKLLAIDAKALSQNDNFWAMTLAEYGIYL